MPWNKTIALKVSGCVTGLLFKPAALDRFCLIAAIMISVSGEFQEQNETSSHSRKEHYQLTDYTSSREVKRYRRWQKSCMNLKLVFHQVNEYTISYQKLFFQRKHYRNFKP